jgi:tetratricopeptide (TPR) repeat protein
MRSWTSIQVMRAPRWLALALVLAWPACRTTRGAAYIRLADSAPALIRCGVSVSTRLGEARRRGVVLSELAQAALQVHRRDEALALARQSAALLDDESSIESLSRISVVLAIAGDPDAAARFVDSRSPNTLRGLLFAEVADAFAGQGSLVEAGRFVEQSKPWLGRADDAPWYVGSLARASLKSGHRELAESAIRRLEEKRGSARDIELARTAEILWAIGDTSRALALLEEISVLPQSKAEALIALAAIEAKSGRVDKARVLLESAMRTVPPIALALSMAPVYRTLGDIETGEKHLKVRASRARGERAAAERGAELIDVAVAFARLGKSSEAAQILEEARPLLASAPSYIDVRFVSAYTELGDKDAAISAMAAIADDYSFVRAIAAFVERGGRPSTESPALSKRCSQ